jgi:hypothetical protein
LEEPAVSPTARRTIIPPGDRGRIGIADDDSDSGWPSRFTSSEPDTRIVQRNIPEPGALREELFENLRSIERLNKGLRRRGSIADLRTRYRRQNSEPDSPIDGGLGPIWIGDTPPRIPYELKGKGKQVKDASIEESEKTKDYYIRIFFHPDPNEHRNFPSTIIGRDFEYLLRSTRDPDNAYERTLIIFGAQYDV